MDEFGIGRIVENNVTSTGHYRVLVQFYKELIDQLLTVECSSFEIMLKFIVEYRPIEDFRTLNFKMSNNYTKVEIFKSKFV